MEGERLPSKVLSARAAHLQSTHHGLRIHSCTSQPVPCRRNPNDLRIHSWASPPVTGEAPYAVGTHASVNMLAVVAGGVS